MKGLIAFINGENSGCDYHRIKVPLQYSNKDETIISDNISDQKEVSAIIFNRFIDLSIEQILDYKKKGIRFICDIDDYWELPPHHIMYKSWIACNAPNNVQNNIKLADVVLCATNRLYAKIKSLNTNVHVVPNAIPFDEGQFTSYKEETNEFNIVYAGGSSHYKDLKSIERSIELVNNDKSLSNYSFLLGGHSDTAIWNQIERVYNLNGKLKNYTRINNLPLDEYMNVYNTASLSLAPLESNTFNSYKSNLKILEAGCKKIPIICSNVPPYSDDLNLYQQFLLGKNKEWYEWIKYYINNPIAAKDAGEWLGEYVREKYDLKKVNKLREDIINNLIS